MNRREKNEILLSEIQQLKEFYAQQGYIEDSDMYQTNTGTLFLYKVYAGEENCLKIQVSIPTGSRDGSFEDPSEKAYEYKRSIEKQKRIEERYQKIKIEREKKDKEIEEFEKIIFNFLSENKDKDFTSRQLSKELNINLTDVVTCLRKMVDKIERKDNGKSIPYTYCINLDV